MLVAPYDICDVCVATGAALTPCVLKLMTIHPMTCCQQVGVRVQLYQRLLMMTAAVTTMTMTVDRCYSNAIRTCVLQVMGCQTCSLTLRNRRVARRPATDPLSTVASPQSIVTRAVQWQWRRRRQSQWRMRRRAQSQPGGSRLASGFACNTCRS